MNRNLISLLMITLIILSISPACKKDLFEKDELPKDFEYSDNLLIIDSVQLHRILSLDSIGTIRLSSDDPLISKLSVGMVIAGGISETCPNGFLKKITALSSEDGITNISTENATLEEALITANIEFSRSLSINDIDPGYKLPRGMTLKSNQGQGFFFEVEDVVLYDDDGDEGTEEDQIKADGSIYIDPTLDFELKISDRAIQHFMFAVGNDLTTEMDIFVGGEVFSRETEYSLVRIQMNPIYIQAGLLPIVVVPVLEITAGAKAEVTLRVQTSLTQTCSQQYGIEYENGNWEPISHSEYNFSFDPPRLSAGGEVKGYFGPQFNLLLYGIAGPYSDANAFLKLEADVFGTPWWTLYGGAEVGVGVQVEFLGRTIADFYLPNVLQYQRVIAEANGGAEGIIKGIVKDAVTQTPLTGVTIKVVKGVQYYGETTSEANGSYSIAAPAGTGLVVEFSKSGYVPAIYQNIEVEINEDTFLEPVLQVDVSHNGLGGVSGQLLNAFDGSGIPDCQLSFRGGINVTQGTVMATTITNNNGYYALQNLPAGNYTVQAECQGYNEGYFSVVCIGGLNTADQNGTLTPQLNENEIRIILTWGSSPNDLDSHLTGPASGGNRFHVYYYDPDYYSLGVLTASLDHDDVTSYGPETVTIYEHNPGVYRYSVHDYSNRNQSPSFALSNSSAQVKIYRGSNLINTFNVPSNTGGTLWTVFEMSGNQITPVNTLSYESDPSIITAPSMSNDAKLMRNLPLK